MIAELGNYALALSLAVSFFLAIFPLWGAEKGHPQLMSLARPMTYGLFFSLTIAFAALFYLFAVNDFSVQYVVNNSNSSLPIYYRLSAVWGSHEGSLLLWIWLLTLWGAAVALFSKHLPQEAVARVLGIMGIISIGFLLFVLFTSNPFTRTFPDFPVDGRELNPMLQDVGLIFHPPLLYVGYVGFAVNFAMSISALIFNRSAQAIARAMRAWVLVSWLFLTLGIVLGAWWAYYELGWGGWWFWDPVENASLMPWLLGLALLHSLLVTEKQGAFSYWTTLFSLLAFAFSVLGTFIVRSGALTSVHAFALDSSRGYVLLLIFFLLTVGSLSLFALRTNTNESAVKFPLISKTGAILGLNIVLTVATVSTFLGTFYPMLFQAMNWGSISVGAPYFNSIFLPLLTLVLFAMAGTLCLGWFKADKKHFFKRLLLLIPAAVIAYGMIWNALQNDSALRFHFFAYVLLTLAIWVLFVTLWQNWVKVRLAYFGMILAHCGVAIATMGAVMSSYFGSELGVRLAPQQSQQLGQFEFHYDRFSNEIGPNFTAEVAFFNVSKQGKPYAEIVPERRYYDVRTMTMSEVGLDAGLWGDLYIVMGDNLGKGEFTFRLHYKPLIRWLWLGGILMALGALCSAINLKRKRDE